MINLEANLINLFMTGDEFSVNDSDHEYKDTTIISCNGYTFKFKQHDINLKPINFCNQTLITTTVSINNVPKEKVEEVLETIDNICWLLSFAQQCPIQRCNYKIKNLKIESINCSASLINPPKYIIENRGKYIKLFIEQVYEKFIKIKDTRLLTTVFGYLCEANKHHLALEPKLILHYVLIENLKYTFAKEQGYKQKSSFFYHPKYPNLNHLCPDKTEYCFDEKIGLWVHKKYGKCGSAEMIKRMFESTSIQRTKINPILKNRNKIIHEGILLAFSDPTYTQTAIEDLHNVSDLLRQYIFTLLGYKGSYFRSRDSGFCSVCII
ncbi:hypothetical protein [Acinetobacter sp. 197]|uniref:hypothetical protein n=1 Tax=Acinetobacter sp. 197 TaxID=3114696 RepID=UPI003A848FA4